MLSLRSLACALVLAGCARAETPPPPPPPLPELPVQPVAEAKEPVAPHKPLPHEKKPTREPKAKTTGAAYVPPAPPATPPVPLRAAPPPAPPPPAKTKTRVTIPRTDHVHVEIPAGLQGDLDADPRMQSWVDKVIAIADGCHANARSNTGAIEAAITMHENDRPDADVRSVPAQLGGVVACATGALMRTKMPLFTGREGTRYAVRIVFD